MTLFIKPTFDNIQSENGWKYILLPVRQKKD